MNIRTMILFSQEFDLKPVNAMAFQSLSHAKHDLGNLQSKTTKMYTPSVYKRTHKLYTWTKLL